MGIVRDKAAADKAVAADGLNNVIMVQAEITNHQSLLNARDKVTQITGGSLDYLINNAAYIDRTLHDKALDDLEANPDLLEQELMESFKVNAVGIIHTINVFLPLIKEGAAKKVVLISTGMADPDLVNAGIYISGPYTISKAAANMAIFKYNARYKNDGILFFAMSPGLVATRADGEEPTAAIEAIKAMNPGFSGPITTLESAEMCLKVIYDFTAEANGGSFVSHFGNKQWV